MRAARVKRDATSVSSVGLRPSRSLQPRCRNGGIHIACSPLEHLLRMGSARRQVSIDLAATSGASNSVVVGLHLHLTRTVVHTRITWRHFLSLKDILCYIL